MQPNKTLVGVGPRTMSKASDANPGVMTTEATPPATSTGVQRRDLVSALLGVMGVGAAASVLEACSAQAPGAAGQGDEHLGRALEDASGTTVAWVDTVLGAMPPATRTGDLATNNSSGVGNAVLVVAKGCVTKGDGGGGLFYWDTSSTTGDDGGTIIVPSNPAGRWVRIYSGPLDIRWFGATANNASLDNSTAINNAISAATSTGGAGAVFVPGGTFTTQQEISLVSSAAQPLSLSGVGRASTISAILPNTTNSNTNAFTNSGAAISYLSITDLTITGSFCRAIVLSAQGTGTGTSCVSPGSSHITIARCFISGAIATPPSGDNIGFQAALFTSGIDDMWITDNEFTNNGDVNNSQVNSTYDICKWEESTANTPRWRIHIRNNRVFNSFTSICIGLMDVNDSDVIGNSVCQNGIAGHGLGGPTAGGYGIMFHNENSLCTRNIVANNSVSNTWGMGIYMCGASNSIVSSNEVLNSCQGITPGTLTVGAIGVNSSPGSVVEGNVIKKSAAAGIDVGGTFSDGNANTVVSNNYIEGTATFALQVQGSCANLLFSGNVVNNTTGTGGGGHGFYTGGSAIDRLRLIGNSFDSGSGAGLNMNGSTLTNSIIADNNFNNYAGDGIYAAGGANSGNVTISGNVMVGSLTAPFTAWGIACDAGQSVFEANTISGYNYGISCTGTGCRVGSNTLVGVSNPLSVTGAACYAENNRLSASGPMRAGNATLPGGTTNQVAVNTAEVLAGDAIRLTRKTAAGALGHLSYAASAGTFTISSTGTETSVIEWEIVH
jgi:parallel beta-helix repeat protein